MHATVIITTKNRREDLAKAVASALAQTARPEVLVIDDGSTDGTQEFISREFPPVRLHRSDQSLGLIVQRNLAAKLASNPFLISIDDDAVFSTPTVVETTLHEFDHPRVGAVAVPVVDINRSSDVRNKAPDAASIYALYDYVGTAHALRRNIFLKLGGYREILFHQGEEEDYCIRMLNAGYITRAGNADPIHHYESTKRSFARMDYYGARNKVLYAWHNVPFPDLPVRLAGTTVMTSTYSLQPARMLTRLRGVVAAYAIVCTGRMARRPVASRIYKLSQKLKKRGPLPLNEIEGELPTQSPPDSLWP
jgi:glycosyltransferase involved in cell wall biosynthesis